MNDTICWFGIEGYVPPWNDDHDFIVYASRIVSGYGLNNVGPARLCEFWFLLWNLWAITPDWQRGLHSRIDDALGLWNIPEGWQQ